jgi:UDP-N-acetylglucosamine--N-acetylmuramyl-(pentapeptide) pyrophosphoryl-undecaprenol N-acetylglucosamine transferase
VILVSTGTNGHAFDRLLGVLDRVQGDEEMIVQHGPSTLRPTGASCVAAMPFQEFVAAAKRARILVTHAGVGSILVALMAGHRPIIVPRLAEHGEAVDDHQLDLARRLEAMEVATVVLDTSDLPEQLHRTAGGASGVTVRSRIAEDLARYLDDALET